MCLVVTRIKHLRWVFGTGGNGPEIASPEPGLLNPISSASVDFISDVCCINWLFPGRRGAGGVGSRTAAVRFASSYYYRCKMNPGCEIPCHSSS